MNNLDATRRLALEAFYSRYPTARTARTLANDVAITYAAADGEYAYGVVSDALHAAAADVRRSDPTYVPCTCFRCDGYALAACLNGYDVAQAVTS